MHTASDVTLIAYVIPAPYIESGIQLPVLNNFPPLTRCNSKTIISS
jgi:hypothetical protein